MLRDKVKGNIRTWGKTELTTVSFPKGPYTKCFFLYLDCPLNNHIAKTCCCIQHTGYSYAIVSQLGYILIWSGVCDQESTNHSACFVEWKSRYITISNEWISTWWIARYIFSNTYLLDNFICPLDNWALLENVWISYKELLCWSLLGVKGLIMTHQQWHYIFHHVGWWTE